MLCVLSRFSPVRLFVTPWIATHQPSLSMGILMQEYWSGLPCPPPGDLPNPGIEPESLMSPALAGRFFTTSATWKAPLITFTFPHLYSAFLVAQMVKCLSTMQETWVRSLGWEDTLEKEMAIHSRTIAWKIPWTEEPGRLQSMGSQRVGHD